MKPHQIISLMTFEGADNTLAMGDHADHIHVGLKPLYGTELQGRQAGQRGAQAQAVDQADRPPAGDRQPEVSLAPSKYALKVKRRPGSAPAAD